MEPLCYGCKLNWILPYILHFILFRVLNGPHLRREGHRVWNRTVVFKNRYCWLATSRGPWKIIFEILNAVATANKQTPYLTRTRASILLLSSSSLSLSWIRFWYCTHRASCWAYIKLFIIQVYSSLFFKKLRLISAYVAGHHLAALLFGLTRYLIVCNGCDLGFVIV